MSTTAPRTTRQVLDEFKGLLELAVNLLDYPVLAKNEGAGLASDIRCTLREVGDIERFVAEPAATARIAELEAENARLLSIASDCSTKLNEMRHHVMTYDMRKPAGALVDVLYEILNRH